jgi:7,8-dihydroneopterin aldolase/epimerase/oxygenase
MKIGFEDLKIRCIIGALEEEREKIRDLLIDLEAEIFPPSDDDLAKTLDYTLLFHCCQKIAAKKFFLLESFAEALLKELLSDFPIKFVRIKVKKPNVFSLGDSAFVFVEGGR